jgi:hypothetical protein
MCDREKELQAEHTIVMCYTTNLRNLLSKSVVKLPAAGQFDL